MRETIIGTINDLVSDFLYYDRKGDEELSLGAIDDAVKSGKITVEDMVEAFKGCLIRGLKK